MYTIPSNVPESELRIITEKFVSNIELLPNEIKALEFCNLNASELAGYLFDKNGNIYFEQGLQFTLRIKYFKMMYEMLADAGIDSKQEYADDEENIGGL